MHVPHNVPPPPLVHGPVQLVIEQPPASIIRDGGSLRVCPAPRRLLAYCLVRGSRVLIGAGIPRCPRGCVCRRRSLCDTQCVFAAGPWEPIMPVSWSPAAVALVAALDLALSALPALLAPLDGARANRLAGAGVDYNELARLCAVCAAINVVAGIIVAYARPRSLSLSLSLSLSDVSVCVCVRARARCVSLARSLCLSPCTYALHLYRPVQGTVSLSRAVRRRSLERGDERRRRWRGT